MAALVPLVAILLFAGEVDLDGTVVAEARGGQAPQRANAAPTGGFASVLTPGVALRLRQSDLEATLDYQVRMFWRQPNELSRTRPLFLHIASLSVLGQVSPTVTTTAGALLSVGEVDYTALPQVLGAPTLAPPVGAGPMAQPSSIGPGTLPSVAEILSASVRMGADVRASRTWRYSLPLDVWYRQPLGEGAAGLAPGVAGSFLQRQVSVALNPAATARLSRRDELIPTIGFSNWWFESGVDLLRVTPQVGWRRRFSPTDDLRLAAGIAYGWYLGTAPGSGTGSSVSPVGNAEVTRLLLRHRGVGVQGGAGATVEYFVDPILAQAYPRGSVFARALLFVRDNWTVGFEGALGTSLRDVGPLPGGTTPPDQTVASISLPIRHRASESLLVEFGARWSDRAPHFEGSYFGFHQRQFWIYTTLTATSRLQGRWTLPDVGDADRRNRPLPSDEPQAPDRQGGAQGARTP